MMRDFGVGDYVPGWFALWWKQCTPGVGLQLVPLLFLLVGTSTMKDIAWKYQRIINQSAPVDGYITGQIVLLYIMPICYMQDSEHTGLIHSWSLAMMHSPFITCILMEKGTIWSLKDVLCYLYNTYL